MPIYMDRHDVAGVSPADAAKAHEMDLASQDEYGVKFLTYWYDDQRGMFFCLIDAPDIGSATRIHKETHGLAADDIIEVDLAAVEAFLGRIEDPARSGPGDGLVAEAAFRTVMFTDIVGSTAMTERLGNARSLEMVRAHDAIVRRALKDHDGNEIKHTGDGIMASFADTGKAVRCARSIQVALDAFNLASSEPLVVRIGMDAGEPVAENNDLFGGTVQMAARLCGAAEPASIYVTEVIRSAAGGDFAVIDRGAHSFKGFAEPVEVFEVDWH